MKLFFSKLLIFFILLIWIEQTFANNYTLFYGQGCSHCLKVERFIDKNNVNEELSISQKEIWFNSENRELFVSEIKKLNLSEDEVWVPFLLIETESNEKFYKRWDKDIINYFESVINKQDVKEDNSNIEINPKKEWSMFFLFVLVPAALADSINPCAFAVIIILLWSILSKYKKRRKVILAWISFSLSIFVSYYLMWVWLYQALATATNTYILKIIIWSLWIIVWIANLKDFLWYWKWFIVEVPLSWRPKMKQLIKSITSPIWAFFIWLLVSLFLLPCTSWPYITLLWYLSAHKISGYFYLFIYNLIFILPMLLITVIIWFWLKNIDDIEEIRQSNLKLIHLIVWLLMLGLGIYVLVTL